MAKYNVYEGLFGLMSRVHSAMPPLGSLDFPTRSRALRVPPLAQKFDRIRTTVANEETQDALFLVGELQRRASRATGESLIQTKHSGRKVTFDFRGAPPQTSVLSDQDIVDHVIEAASGLSMTTTPSSLSFRVHTLNDAPEPLPTYASRANELLEKATPVALLHVADLLVDLLLVDDDIVERRRQRDQQ